MLPKTPSYTITVKGSMVLLSFSSKLSCSYSGYQLKSFYMRNKIYGYNY